MNNVLEFIMKLTDQLTPAMRSAASVSDQASSRITSNLTRVTSSSRTMANSLSDLRSKLQQVNDVRMNTRIASQFSEATREARRLEAQINRMERRGSGGGMLGGLGGLIPGIGAVALGGGAIKAAAAAEMSKVNFSTLLGSKQAGNAMYGDLTQFANETVFDNQGVYKNAQTLMAFGVEGDKVMKTLKMLGDVSLGDQQRMESLTLAFAQVGAAGRLTGQDLLQFVNAGFNPLQEISKQTGISMADLKKKMEDGAISSAMVTEAFERATGAGGKFHNALQNAGDTVTGRYGVLMGSIQTRLIAIGEALRPVTVAVMEFANILLSSGPGLAAVATGIAVVAAATINWGFAQGIVNTVMQMNPMVRIISLILILGGIIWSVASRFTGWGESMKAIWEIIKAFTRMAVASFMQFGEGIWFAIQYGWLKFQSFIEWIQGALQNVGRAMQFVLTLEFGKAKDALFQEIVTPSSKALEQLEKNKNKSAANYQALLATERQNIAEQSKRIGLKEASKVKSSSPLDQAPANPAGKSGSLSMDSLKDTKSKADNINSGGSRPITITIGKQIESLQVHVLEAKEGAEEIAKIVQEQLRRVLYSINGAANA